MADDRKISESYLAFIFVASSLTKSRLERDSRVNTKKYFGRWIEASFEQTLTPEMINALEHAWGSYSEFTQNQASSSLIADELESYVQIQRDIESAETTDGSGAIERLRRIFKTPAKETEILKATKTTLESLIDLFKDFLPPWAIGIFKSLKEALDIVT